jgi:leucyl aminopeptidase
MTSHLNKANNRPMKFTTQITPLAEVAADWLVIGAWENEDLPGAADLDARLDGLLTRLQERGDVTGKARELTPIHHSRPLPPERVLVVGLGPQNKADFAGLLAVASSAARSLTTKQVRRLAFALPHDVPGLALDQIVRAIGVGLAQGSQGPGLRKSEADRFQPDEICLVASPGTAASALDAALRRAGIEAAAVSLARELVNLPPSELYPDSFAQRAGEVSRDAGLECQVLEAEQLEAERMNALLAVARGSERPPRVVVLRHSRGNGPMLGLVGKGVTFDSGGLSLKTTEQMVDMKCDMAGAAAVLGAMRAIGELGLPVNVLGVLALVENMPGGRAMKLGDVLTARNGKTIEVLNTDAEGRLILADALAYAVDQGANQLVDLATLTGACMVALGHDVAGLMTNDETWGQRVQAAAQAVGERAWPLPMFPHYAEMIKSDVADIKNTGGSRYAGAITAAKFLEEFVAGVPWVHLDIAGPAWAERENATRASGGTGCFVRTLVELAARF